jgi:hypothetical protein
MMTSSGVLMVWRGVQIVRHNAAKRFQIVPKLGLGCCHFFIPSGAASCRHAPSVRQWKKVNGAALRH